MRNQLLLIATVLLCFLFVGCSSQQESVSVYEEINYEYIAFQPVSSGSALFNHISLIDDKDVAVLQNNSDGSNSFVRYCDGKAVYEKQLSEPYDALYYDKASDFFLSYNVLQNRLERLNADFETEEYLIEDFYLFEIKHMAIKDDILYMLYVEENPYEKKQEPEMDEETGYINYGEKVCAFSLESGELESLPINNVICQYMSDKGTLYYYTYEENSYHLKRYDPIQKKVLEVREMNDVGYIYSFIIAEDNFIYSGIEFDDIGTLNLTTGLKTTRALKVHIVRGMDFQQHKGNLICMNRYVGQIECLYLGSDVPITSEKTELVHRGENLVIGLGAPDMLPINLKKMAEDTGITTSAYTTPMFEDELLLKLMAGDSDVDIYIFWSTYSIGRNIRKNGIYVPLNDSEIITEELSKYWDYVAEFAYADNGDIWAVPLAIDTYATWYVPENTEELGLTYDNFEMVDDFMDSLKLMNEQERFVFYSNVEDVAHYTTRMSYNINYSDTQYNNELYKHLFETLWGGGWVRHSGPYAHHPLFNREWQEEEDLYKTDEIAFKTQLVTWQLSSKAPFDGFRVYPAPKVVSQEDKTPVWVTYAVINPYSKKIDAATEYLEFVMQYNKKYSQNTRNEKSTCLQYRDIDAYLELYDTESLGFQDLYAILQNGAVWEASMPVSFQEYIIDYQTGRYTLDEVAEYLQRQTEMALNE